MVAKAVFLDKDGTLIEDIPYNVDPDLIQLSPGALEALSLLQALEYRLIIVTNQSGVARGFFREEDLQLIDRRLREILFSAGISLTGFYYCPHHPEGAVGKYTVVCFCRKPQPGMLYSAAFEHNLDLHASWLVGDILNDIEAGNRAGCRTVLIDNYQETEWELTAVRQPAFIAKGLKEVASIIANESIKRNWSHGEQEH